VPPSARSSRPTRRWTAPVNAPRSWPNSSLSNSVSGRLAQSTVSKGPAARRDARWTARAAISFPVPLSPTTRSGTSESATAPIRLKTSCIAGERPTRRACGSASAEPPGTAAAAARAARARSAAPATWARSIGFGR
jgi:hypothetical protein